jgi:hypothetical protein
MSADDSYDQVRHDFEDLEMETRARFLVEASASTLAKGIERAGHVLAEGLEDVIEQEWGAEPHGAESGPGAAEPETAQQQAPPSDPSSTDEG